MCNLQYQDKQRVIKPGACEKEEEEFAVFVKKGNLKPEHRTNYFNNRRNIMPNILPNWC